MRIVFRFAPAFDAGSCRSGTTAVLPAARSCTSSSGSRPASLPRLSQCRTTRASRIDDPPAPAERASGRSPVTCASGSSAPSAWPRAGWRCWWSASYAVETTGSPVLVALLVILRMLPLAVFGSIVGTFADRLAPRLLLTARAAAGDAGLPRRPRACALRPRRLLAPGARDLPLRPGLDHRHAGEAAADR